MQNQITFAAAISKTFRSWRDYRGVSSRREYWLFTLFTFLLGLVTNTIDNLIAGGQSSDSYVTFSSLVQLVLLAFVLPLVTRRYHDAGFSGFWQLLDLIPITVVLFKIQAITIFLSDPVLALAAKGTDLSEAQSLDLLAKFIDAFALIFVLAFAAGVFQLVLTLLPSKPSWRGNRFAPITQPEPVWGYAVAEQPASNDPDQSK
jgi:uncharacterized membrane protein YhaH (DUF805 family)